MRTNELLTPGVVFCSSLKEASNVFKCSYAVFTISSRVAFSMVSTMHRVDDVCDLLEVRSLMDNQPLRIGQHGRFEDPSHRRHSRSTRPGIDRQRGEDSQEIGTLRHKGAERGPEFQFRIVRLLDPGAGTDRPPRRSVLSDDRHDVVAPDVSTRTQMSKHLVGGPLIRGGAHLQLFW